MSPTKKGNQWYIGPPLVVCEQTTPGQWKAHIGVGAKSGLVHTFKTTTAKVHDTRVTDDLTREDDPVIFADKGYVSDKRKCVAQQNAILWAVKDKRKRGRPLSPAQKKRKRKHGAVRAKVEYAFHVIKCQFFCRRTRYRGLTKNAAQIFSLMALANLYIARRNLRLDSD